MIDEDEFLSRLQKSVNQSGGRAAWAAEHGIALSYLCDVLNGNRKAGGKIAEAMGLRRVVAFAEKEST